MKLIAKINGKEVREFSVIIGNLTFRRDFEMLNNVLQGVVSEFDREYFSGGISDIVYSTGPCEKFVWHPSVEELDNIDRYEWLCSLQRDYKSFKITDEIVKDSKEHGPFEIVKE